MKEADAQSVLQRAKERYPEARPRVISDNGPQLVANDFKEFIRIWQASHVHLHSAIDYVTPKDKLKGRAVEVCSARDQKLGAAREMRR